MYSYCPCACAWRWRAGWQDYALLACVLMHGDWCLVMGACAYKVSKLQMLSFASRTSDARVLYAYVQYAYYEGAILKLLHTVL